MGVNGYSTYSATKAAQRSYARTWTREFNERGIRFNTSSPGPIDTPNELETVRFSLKPRAGL